MMLKFVRTGLARATSTRMWMVQSRYCSEHVQFKQVSALRPAVMADYISFPNSKLHSLIWHKPLQNVFVTKKPVTKKTKDAMVEFITHMHDFYPEINVIVQPHVAEEIKHEFKSRPKSCPGQPHVLYVGQDNEIVEKTDLLVSLGGDGTILHAVSMFSHSQVPPVLAFSLGTLGFLLPFDFKEFREVFENILHSTAKCLHRPRLLCHLVRNGQVEISRRMYSMNDIFIHRGNSPHLAQMEVFVGNEYLTTTIADGVVIATPTGSTAYSLSAGGSIVSPLVPSILLTPICPRSLSFRPVILPCSSHIKVVIGRKPSQGPGAQVLKLSIDGMPQRDLHPGDEIHVVNEVGTIYINGAKVPPMLLHSATSKAIRHPGIFCVAKTENDWIRGINELLGFNSGFRAHSKQ